MFARRFTFFLLLAGAVFLLFAVAAVADSPLFGPHTVIIHQFDGEQVGDGFGWVGTDLGDLTGDGIHELLIPAPFFADANGFPIGKFYVYSGSDGALLHSEAGQGYLGYSAARAGDVNADGVADYIVSAPIGRYANVYSGADHTILLTFNAGPGEFFGASVTGAGDVNGDGRADLLVGAQNASYSFTNAGRVYLYSGLDGSLLWTADGPSALARLGSGAGLVGDVNGDNVPDSVVGAMGVAQAFVLSGVDGNVIHTLSPERPADAAVFGQFFASGAGDHNADGIPDVFVADYAATVDGVPGTGNAFVFSGADGAILEAMDGREPGGGFGPGRAFEDIDGDGYGDLVIGSWTSSQRVPSGGKVEVFSGRGPRRAVLVQKIIGNISGDSLGVDALPVGDLNGDGLVDFMATAVGNNFSGTDVGHVYIVAGDPFPPGK